MLSPAMFVLFSPLLSLLLRLGGPFGLARTVSAEGKGESMRFGWEVKQSIGRNHVFLDSCSRDPFLPFFPLTK